MHWPHRQDRCEWRRLPRLPHERGKAPAGRFEAAEARQQRYRQWVVTTQGAEGQRQLAWAVMAVGCQKG